MANITFIQNNGTKHTIDIDDGISLMQGAVSNNIPGIAADCGGSMSCGTCRVLISPEWADRIGYPTGNEQQMLDFLSNGKQLSRLACQITVSAAINGLLVFVPESQAG